MSPIGPPAEKVIEHVVNLIEGRAAHDCSVVIAPTLDQRVQTANEGTLGYPSSLSYYLGQPSMMKDHLLFAGLDVGLVTQRSSDRILSGVVFAHGILTDVESEEVKPDLAIVFL
jgi:hypothetical protein